MRARLAYFPFFPSDWLSSSAIADLTLEQEAIYVRMLAMAWLDEGKLPRDPEKLARRIGRGARTSDIEIVIARHWHGRNGVIHNLRLTAELAKADKAYNRKCKNLTALDTKSTQLSLTITGSLNKLGGENQNQNQNKTKNRKDRITQRPLPRSAGAAPLLAVEKKNIVQERIEKYEEAIKGRIGRAPTYSRPQARAILGRLLASMPSGFEGDWMAAIDSALAAFVLDDGKDGWLKRDGWPLAYFVKHANMYLGKTEARKSTCADRMCAGCHAWTFNEYCDTCLALFKRNEVQHATH